MKDHVTERLQYVALMVVFMVSVFAIGALYIQVRANRIRSEVACVATNKIADTELKLWNYILGLPPTNTRELTPEQKAVQDKQVAEFRVYINKAFSQKECS